MDHQIAEMVLDRILGYGVPRSARAVGDELGWSMESVYTALVWLEARGYARPRYFDATRTRRMGWVALVDKLPLLVPSRSDKS